jgi:hypothetical protein
VLFGRDAAGPDDEAVHVVSIGGTSPSTPADQFTYT